MNTLVRLRISTGQSIPLIRLIEMLRGASPKDHIVQRGLTRICIESYPRSANSFAVRMFRTANEVPIGHHTHSTANIARALRYGIPTVVLIRSPVGAITSLAVARGGGDIDCGAVDYGVWYYLTFYRWVERRVNSVVIAEFEMVISDFNRVIRLVNEKYHTTFNYIENLDVAAERVKQDIRSRFVNQRERRKRRMWMPILRNALPDALLRPHERKDARLKWIPIPNVEREKAKEGIRSLILRHKHIGEAQTLYARLLA